jgi:hypothetical protein
MTVRGDSRGDDCVSGMRSCASRSVEFGLKTDLHKSRVGGAPILRMTTQSSG